MSIPQKIPEQPITIKTDLAELIQQELGENLYLCYQCVKCTSGCPVGEFFDWQPNQIMRALQLGQDDIALEAKTPWLCASCQACTTRCPQGLNIAAIMDYLTQLALERGIRPKVPEVDYFNTAFMREVRLWGRAYELGLIVEMKLRTLDIMADLDLGVKMFRKNKMPLLPHLTRPPHKVKLIPNAVSAIAYYPGCSLHSTATEFDTSTRAVFQTLEVKLIEPQGWICCGSSAAHRSDPEAALRLPMENLSIIEQSGFKEVMMPCAACFNRHKTAQHEIKNDPHHGEAVAEIIDYHYQDKVLVNTLMESILRHVGLEKVKSKVVRNLGDLNAVCYYGCLLTRPPEVTGSKHAENPTDMDEIVSALGVNVLDWSYKTCCCGAAHSLSRPDIVLKLSNRLIQQARVTGADLIVVACPLCHTNLDARQTQMMLDETIPVLYLSQLMAYAFGLPDKAVAFHKNLIDPRRLIEEKLSTM
ncbi:MAG TPA: heterodisulfide reductase-related iron-sulfur binding cluster [Anaerolineales bacterium]|nr:heterodisulfide reductase-related iron-sulfur binding cluster [Anaerolineales bacterium]